MAVQLHFLDQILYKSIDRNFLRKCEGSLRSVRNILWEWALFVAICGQCKAQKIFLISKSTWECKEHFLTSFETDNLQHHKYLAWLSSKINKKLCITCGCSVTFFRSMGKQLCLRRTELNFLSKCEATLRSVRNWETFYENEHCESQFVSNWNYRIS